MFVEDEAKTTDGHGMSPMIGRTAAPPKMTPGVAM